MNLLNFSVNELLYLLPTLTIAALLKFLMKKHPIFFTLNLVGTLSHELCHFFVGYLTFANPTAISIIPRKESSSWTLGSVTFKSLRWFNAAPTALAPLILIVVPIFVSKMKTSNGYSFGLEDLIISLMMAPLVLSCWPSSVDWRLSLKSWPYFIFSLIFYFGFSVL